MEEKNDTVIHDKSEKNKHKTKCRIQKMELKVCSA